MQAFRKAWRECESVAAEAASDRGASVRDSRVLCVGHAYCGLRHMSPDRVLVLLDPRGGSSCPTPAAVHLQQDAHRCGNQLQTGGV